MRFTFKRRHVDLTPQTPRPKTDRNFAIKIVVFTLEDLVFLCEQQRKDHLAERRVFNTSLAVV